MGRRLLSFSLALILPALVASQGCAQKTPTAEPVGTLRFIESYPEETELDMPSLDQAHQVWPQVLANADHSVNVASFYFSRQGDGNDAYAPEGVADKLAPIIEDLKKAADRGCQVQVLGDGKFYETYPEALTWLDEQDGVAALHIDVRAHWGGVMHAKYFVVDDKILYVGSQNWDWRALTQIHELGALVEHPGLARQLKQIFDLDWNLAQAASPAEIINAEGYDVFSTGWDDVQPALLTTASGDTVQAFLAASPPQALPDGVPWDLPLIVETIDAATTQVRLQLLSYGVTDRENRFFATLDNALRRAAVRKVKVQIILANWAKSRYALPWIQSLAAVPNIEIKFSNIPEHSEGFIPFARVEHAKYLTVDGTTGWTGTSNWSRDYFYSSRNISLFLRGPAAIEQLDSFFQISWDGPFTETVDPCGQYSPPKRN